MRCKRFATPPQCALEALCLSVSNQKARNLSWIHACRSAKQLVVKYPAMCVAAWAYITAAVSMGLTALLFVERSSWEVPRQLLGPLVYWIFVCSVVGYYVVTWATQHLPASQVRRSIRCKKMLNIDYLWLT